MLEPQSRQSADDGLTRSQLETLVDVANDLAGQFALQPLLERILRHAMRLLGCERGSISTVDEVTGTYRKEVDVGVGCHSGHTFPLDEGVTGAVVAARGTVVFDRYRDVPKGHLQGRELDSLYGVIGVPIHWDGAIIGTAIIFSADQDRLFTDEDANLLKLFAQHAAIAITNSRLHALAAERERNAAVLAERERVVRDVHDTVGRGLAAVLLHLDNAERQLEAGQEFHPSLTEARLATGMALLETRRTVLGFGPEALDGRPLGDAIALELEWVESTTSVATDLVVVGEIPTLVPEVSRQLFRIVQECLTNVVKHAQANRLRVGIIYGSESIVVLIEDDGRGFEVPSPTNYARSTISSPGLGLRGLVARAQHLGGSVHINSEPGWGTSVRAELPYANSRASAQSHDRWRVLVAHESPIVRAGLVRMLGLAEPDIQVVGEVGSAQEVLDSYGLLRPQVVLADISMRHLDGARLTSYIRAIDPAAAMVLLIDQVGDDRVRDAAQAGAVGFIARDTNAAGLARAVVAAARGDSLMTSEVFNRFATLSEETDGESALTEREREVCDLIEQGIPNKQIAVALNISTKTVEKHVGAILRKTGAPNRTVLARRAVSR